MCVCMDARRPAASRGVSDILLSLSHDGDYAGAVATVTFCTGSNNPSPMTTLMQAEQMPRSATCCANTGA